LDGAGVEAAAGAGVAAGVAVDDDDELSDEAAGVLAELSLDDDDLLELAVFFASAAERESVR
jgi:hypothetical protein